MSFREARKLDPVHAHDAGAMQLLNGRLHYSGGSLEDRVTPASDHWSLAVDEGRAIGGWREEAPIPRGGPHRGSTAIGGSIYVFGGQASDFGPIEGNPDCHCAPSGREDHFADVYRLEPEGTWRRMPDMPITASHTEQSTVTFGDSALIAGGSIDYDYATQKFELTDLVQIYDARKQSWAVGGRLPYRVKSAVVGYWDGWLYTTGGQRDVGPDDPTPGDVVGEAWRCRFRF